MPSTTERYSAAASQSASTVEKIADFWTQGSRRLSDHMLPGLPQVDLVPVVERYFEFVQRTVDISRNLTLSWAEAAGTLSGAVREQAESMGGLVREQARRAHEEARQRYEGLTKAELSDLLDKRNLPKTGNVDELVERLVEADSK
jgi:SAP domain